MITEVSKGTVLVTDLQYLQSTVLLPIGCRAQKPFMVYVSEANNC